MGNLFLELGFELIGSSVVIARWGFTLRLCKIRKDSNVRDGLKPSMLPCIGKASVALMDATLIGDEGRLNSPPHRDDSIFRPQPFPKHGATDSHHELRSNYC